MPGSRVLWIAVVLAACGGGGSGGVDATPIDAMPDAFVPTCRSFVRAAPIPFPARPDTLAPLASVAVPAPTGGDIVDFDAAVRLGKLLFWDTQASSDGKVACASCHFSAGADTRLVNAINPGPDGMFGGNGVTAAGQTSTTGNTRGDDRVASEGVIARTFVGLPADASSDVDTCTDDEPKPPFGAFRQVTPRNTPSVVGAALAESLFWDGRASRAFNGVDPFGTGSNAGSGDVAVDHAPLASQAMAPIVSNVEMSCAGRQLDGQVGVGAKLLSRVPLARQVVAPDDGSLGCMSRAPATGVQCDGAACTYRDLFAAAFGSALATNAEDHFGRLWGQAIAAYESTLIPDQTPFDKYMLGDATALTMHQRQGMTAFVDVGCVKCHSGAELSDASASFAALNGPRNHDGGDQGFHNTGVRPTSAGGSEDLGRAEVGPKGASYSISKSDVDRGAFKTAQLRGVKLTAPYFHNGGKATLDDVVEFYAAGGDFKGTASQLKGFVFLSGQQQALIDFLKNALTDCRVEMAASPFDHPSLDVPDGPSLPAVGAAGSGSCVQTP